MNRDAINQAVNKISELTGEDFHGYRSEIFYAISGATKGQGSTEKIEKLKAEKSDLADAFKLVSVELFDVKATLKDALEWLEDVRWGEDGISEDWYQNGRKLIPFEPTEGMEVSDD